MDDMILGTMIPIPNDQKKSLCDSSNYWAVALISIFFVKFLTGVC